jgi:hypothetical protein
MSLLLLLLAALPRGATASARAGLGATASTRAGFILLAKLREATASARAGFITGDVWLGTITNCAHTIHGDRRKLRYLPIELIVDAVDHGAVEMTYFGHLDHHCSAPRGISPNPSNLLSIASRTRHDDV